MRARIPVFVEVATVFLAALVCVRARLHFSDLGIYLAQGREMAANGGFADVDRWTHPMAGVHYVNASWLAEKLLYLVWSLGGFSRLLALRVILVVSTLVIAAAAARRLTGRPGVVALAAPLAFMLVSQTLVVRPQLFALPLFAGYAALAMTARPSAASILGGAALTGIWANLHGAFVLAPILSIAVAAGVAWEEGAGSLRRLDGAGGHLLAAGAALLAAFANPYGPGIYHYVWENTFVSTDRGISEWAPTTIKGLAGIRLALAATALAAECHAAKRLPAKRDLPALLAFGILAASGVRYVCWLGPIVPLAIARLFGEERAAPRRPMLELIPIATVMALIGICPGERTPGALPAECLQADTPAALADFAATHGVSGNVFNPMEWGSAITWRVPDARTFLDIRVWIVPDAVWRDYVTVSTAEYGWEDRLDSYGVRFAILSRKAQPQLIPWMERSDRWKEIYADDRGLIFEHR